LPEWGEFLNRRDVLFPQIQFRFSDEGAIRCFISKIETSKETVRIIYSLILKEVLSHDETRWRKIQPNERLPPHYFPITTTKLLGGNGGRFQFDIPPKENRPSGWAIFLPENDPMLIDPDEIIAPQLELIKIKNS
jgi:hypothetical protein